MSISNPKPPISAQLEASHIVLLDCISALKTSSRDFASLKTKLTVFIDSLLGHFQIQNDELFRILEENYRRQNPQSQMPFFFKAELKELKVTVYGFMEQYMERPSPSVRFNFNRDLKELIQTVLQRIETERAYMVPYC